MCERTGKRVLAAECVRCAATNKLVLKHLLVRSSVSQALVLADVAIRSAGGKFCLPLECQACAWSGQKFHPDDLKVCHLTGLTIHFEFLTREPSRLRVLVEMLEGVKHSMDGREEYPVLEGKLSAMLNGSKCRIISGTYSPTNRALAICAEVKFFMGLRTNYAGFVYSSENEEITGRIAQGKRSKQSWIEN
jgi:hypothetical protein